MRLRDLTTVAISVPVTPPPGGRGHPIGAIFVTYCLVRAETDDGLVGWGEISDGWGCEYAEVADALVREALSRFVLDRDPREVARIVPRMWAWLRRRQGRTWLVAQAISGVEIALCDLAARAQNKPVSELFGAPSTRIPVLRGVALSQGDPRSTRVLRTADRTRSHRGQVRLGPTGERAPNAPELRPVGPR